MQAVALYLNNKAKGKPETYESGNKQQRVLNLPVNLKLFVPNQSKAEN
jgi:hypothetical protein